jgi:pantetheine-phosphate adenylyltransferase
MHMSKNRIAVYPGTFDPITLGHEDIVHRAAALFDEVIVAVAGSTNKRTLFSFDERVSLAQAVFKKTDNIKVVGLCKSKVRKWSFAACARPVILSTNFNWLA